MKIVPHNQTKVLAVDQDFAKLYYKLKFPGQEGRIVKPFTRPGAISLTGRGNYVSASCKVFHLEAMSQEFREDLDVVFEKDAAEDAVEEDEEEEGMT